jgi:hypothetical protein
LEMAEKNGHLEKGYTKKALNLRWKNKKTPKNQPLKNTLHTN